MSLLAPIIASARPDLAIDRPSSTPLGDDDWTALMQSVISHRLSGLLWAAVEADLPVTAAQRVDAASLHHDSMRTIAELEAGAIWVLGQLEDAGIDARIIKGLATAHLIHPSPQHRDTGDIDLLVVPDDFAEASWLLRRSGLVEERRWGLGADSFAKENVFILPGGFEVDLHQSLAFGQRWRRLTPQLMTNGMALPHGRTLSLEGLLISSCVSASGSDWRVSGLLDVAAISRDPRLDRKRLAALVSQHHLGPLLLPVLDHATRYFAIDQTVRDVIAAETSPWWAEALQRVETSKGGARFLYSCLSGPMATWPRGLSALAFPRVDTPQVEQSSRGRRLFDRSTELVLPSTYR